jgi:hypothetical protein
MTIALEMVGKNLIHGGDLMIFVLFEVGNGGTIHLLPNGHSCL